ncbi:hypothetical protein HaLaN_04129 [Haematococcus lacustris]|uniref:Uncharacterized protein n=1 Tax=Haematococcus lacustris TaxID=44745 RepID=A0A699YG23_HAELA|nr:hypothetical protein HaLaN_04129 [Haematococcus lacustris]
MHEAVTRQFELLVSYLSWLPLDVAEHLLSEMVTAGVARRIGVRITGQSGLAKVRLDAHRMLTEQAVADGGLPVSNRAYEVPTAVRKQVAQLLVAAPEFHHTATAEVEDYAQFSHSRSLCAA